MYRTLPDLIIGLVVISQLSTNMLIILTCKQFNGFIKIRRNLVVREIKSLCHHAGLQWADCYIHVNGHTPDGYILGLPDRQFLIDVTIAIPTGANHILF